MAPTADAALALAEGVAPEVAVTYRDAALEQAFAHHAVDPGRIAVSGFSDGASYALSLGLTNGTLLTHVLAFSPGFTAPAATRDSPRFFLSHGTDDAVLPYRARQPAPGPDARGRGLRRHLPRVPGRPRRPAGGRGRRRRLVPGLKARPTLRKVHVGAGQPVAPPPFVNPRPRGRNQGETRRTGPWPIST